MAYPEIYAQVLHKSHPLYYANFEPNRPVVLGDLGIMNHGVFKRQAKAFDKVGIEIIPNNTPSEPGHIQFSSKGGVSSEFILHAEAGTEAIKAKSEIKLEFSRKNGVFFNAADTKFFDLEDELIVNEQILELFKNGNWDPDWVLVTGIIETEALLLIISGSKNASITLSANNSAPIDLSDARYVADLKISNQKDIAYTWVGDKKAKPLLQLSAVRRKFLTGTPITSTDFLAETGGISLSEERRRIINSGGNLEDFFEFRTISGSDSFVW